MTERTIAEIAAQPYGPDQVTRAAEVVDNDPALQGLLDTFLASNPTRGQMTDFLATLRAERAAIHLRQKIDAICRTAGIEHPSGADKLAAMQIGLLQEQNAILQNGLGRALNQMRADAKAADESSDGFTGLLAGVMLGAIALRT